MRIFFSGGVQNLVRAAMLAAFTFLAVGATFGQSTSAPASSGETPEDPFTVEWLIGDSVSLSNQKYPEVESAIQRFKNGDVAGAKEFLDAAFKKNPKLPPTEVSLSKMFFVARDVERGRMLLEAAITTTPADPEAYLLLADQSFAEGRTAESHAMFTMAQSMVNKFNDSPKRRRNFDIKVLAGLAAVQERRQQWSAAETLLKKWLEFDPDSVAAHQRYGVVLYKLNNSAQALAEFAKCRKLQATYQHPQVTLGQLYYQEGKKDEAKQAFEKAYAEEPANETTARSYAEWLIQQNELEKAQTVSTELRKKAPESTNAILLDGLVAKMRSDRKAAEDAFMKVIVLDPSNARATDLLALLLAESTNVKDKERALSYAQNNAQRFAQSTKAQVTLVWVLNQLNRTKESDEMLGRILQAGGQLDADSIYLVSRILVAKGKKAEALTTLKQVLSQSAAAFLYRKEAEKLVKDLETEGVKPSAVGVPGAPPAAAPPTTPPAAPPAK